VCRQRISYELPPSKALHKWSLSDRGTEGSGDACGERDCTLIEKERSHVSTHLVPLDGSLHAERALPIVAGIARATSGLMHLMQVINQPIDYSGGLHSKA